MRFGLASTADPQADPAFAAMALEARARIRERVHSEDLASYVELFDRDAYHSNISVAENLLFGTPRHPAISSRRTCPAIPRSCSCCATSDCSRTSTPPASKVAGLMVELFADVAADSPMFDQYSFISADDLPEFRTLLAKIADGSLAAATDEEKARLLALTFRIVVAQHRLGVIDEERQRKIVEARAEFRRRYTDRDDVVEFFDPDRFSSTLSIQDNILFGRVAFEQANALDARQRRWSARSRRRWAWSRSSLRLGLEYEVGNGGSRLSYSQRQRLAIARGDHEEPRHPGLQRAHVRARSGHRSCACCARCSAGRRVARSSGRLAGRTSRGSSIGCWCSTTASWSSRGRSRELEREGALLPRLLA